MGSELMVHRNYNLVSKAEVYGSLTEFPSQMMYIALNNSFSTSCLFVYGVLQGFVLSPMLANIYMKPLGEIVRRFGLHGHQRADDMQLSMLTFYPKEALDT